MKLFKYILLLSIIFISFNSKSFALETTKYHKVEMLLKKSNQGDAQAQYELGKLYANGDGVPQNINKAFEWFTKAANQNNTDAQAAIGSMYFSGQGTPRDKKKALEWLMKAEQKNNDVAPATLGAMYAYGDGVPQDIKKAKIYLQKACLNKVQKACNLLKKLNN